MFRKHPLYPTELREPDASKLGKLLLIFKFMLPQPYSRHACSRTDAALFWTCIKIAKALRDFNGIGVSSFVARETWVSP